MNALEIIDEIRQLPAEDREVVKKFVGRMDRELSGKELKELADKFVAEPDDRRAEELKKQLIAGFYGNPMDA